MLLFVAATRYFPEAGVAMSLIIVAFSGTCSEKYQLILECVKLLYAFN